MSKKLPTLYNPIDFRPMNNLLDLKSELKVDFVAAQMRQAELRRPRYKKIAYKSDSVFNTTYRIKDMITGEYLFPRDYRYINRDMDKAIVVLNSEWDSYNETLLEYIVT